MIKKIVLFFIVLVSQSVLAQECNKIVNATTGQLLKVECFQSNGQLIQNGNVLIANQQLMISNGRITGCSGGNFSISFGFTLQGHQGHMNFGQCLQQAVSQMPVRVIGQSSGTTFINNGTVQVNGAGVMTLGNVTSIRRAGTVAECCPDGGEPYKAPGERGYCSVREQSQGRSIEVGVKPLAAKCQ